MISSKTHDIVFPLFFLAGFLAAPLVLAGIGSLDLVGQNRAAPPTMGALEVAAIAAAVPEPTPAPAPSVPSVVPPSTPAGLVLSTIRVP